MLRGIGTAGTTSRIVCITANEGRSLLLTLRSVGVSRRYAGGGGYRGDELEANKQLKPDNYRYVSTAKTELHQPT